MTSSIRCIHCVQQGNRFSQLAAALRSRQNLGCGPLELIRADGYQCFWLCFKKSATKMAARAEGVMSQGPLGSEVQPMPWTHETRDSPQPFPNTLYPRSSSPNPAEAEQDKVAGQRGQLAPCLAGLSPSPRRHTPETNSVWV